MSRNEPNQTNQTSQRESTQTNQMSRGESTQTNQMSRNKSRTTVDLPAGIERQITERIHQTEFDSVDGYVAFVLEQLLAEIDRQQPVEKEAPDSDHEDIEERLESLGYL